MSVTMCKSIWLHVASSGSCTSSEIVDNFPAYRNVYQKLQEMWKAGMLVRAEAKSDGLSRFIYSVTPECGLPRGLKLEEVLEVAQ